MLGKGEPVGTKRRRGAWTQENAKSYSQSSERLGLSVVLVSLQEDLRRGEESEMPADSLPER